jgi:hypothetical protein
MGKREMSAGEFGGRRGGLGLEKGDVKRMIRQCEDAIAVIEAILRRLSTGKGGDGL